MDTFTIKQLAGDAVKAGASQMPTAIPDLRTVQLLLTSAKRFS
jgi:hypothetical protein